VHDTGGNAKIVPVGTECGDNASPVLWNRQGPAGADGVSGYQVFAVPETQQDAPAGGLVEVEAACPVGKVPLGSGFASIGSARLGGFEVEESIPSENVWVVAWRNVTTRVRPPTSRRSVSAPSWGSRTRGAGPSCWLVGRRRLFALLMHRQRTGGSRVIPQIRCFLRTYERQIT